MDKKNNRKKLLEKILKDRRIRQDITRRDFEWFFLTYFARHFRYETPPFHQEMFRILQDDSIDLAVFTAFRGSAKSTIVTTAYVIWAILGVQQKKFISIQSQTEQKARGCLMNIKREFEQNQLLRSDLGPFREEAGQWGSQALIITRLNARITIGSVEQSIRGSLFGEHRPDLIILDDVEDTSSVRTHESRNKTFEWFTGEVVPAGDIGTKIVAVGNLLHEDSLMKRLQELIESGKRKGVYREYPIVDRDGNPTWPGKYPTKESIEAERAKVMNEVAWAREYLFKIVAPEDQVIKPEWIQYYDDLPEPTFHTFSATGIDLAISKEQNADKTAMVSAQIHGRYSPDLKIYILPNIVNKRFTSLEALTAAKKISDSLYGKGKLFIESNGYQQSFVEHMKSARYPAEGVRSTGDKYSRLNMVSFLVESGTVLFPREGAKELRTQLLGFGTERYDDLVDAFSILLLKISEMCTGRGLSAISEPGEPRFDAMTSGNYRDFGSDYVVIGNKIRRK